MGIPIIFIHTGDPYYLDFSLNQAHVSNPDSDIYLITDVLTCKYEFIKYIDIKSLRVEANKFEEVYNHMSTNSYQAELFCFQRWFILKEFCSKNHLNSFLYLDSDMMLYCDVNSTFSKFNHYQFTITNKQGPQCCYFSSLNHLDNFCNFIIKLYNDKDYKGRFELKYAEHLSKKLNGGVCDMTAFIEYQNDYPQAAKDLSVIENREVFDDNFNVSDGFSVEKIGKQITVENKFPYGVLKKDNQKIKFNTLHFQGPAKKYIYKFYLGSNLNSLKRKIGFDLFLLEHHTLFRIFRRLGYKIFDY
jgi:hypothetical protein